MKKGVIRAVAATLAALAPAVATVAISPAAQAEPGQTDQAVTPATIHFGKTPNLDPKKASWRFALGQYQQAGFDNVEEAYAYSPSMDRYVPLVVIRPLDKAKRANAPTLYLLNGADGGEGGANWLMQTDVVEYLGGLDDPSDSLRAKAGLRDPSPGIGANIVIPMSGAFSYYSDWVNEAPQLGGKQMWETFLTKELPAPLESALGANGKRALAGMSMSGTTSLLYAEHNPGFYDALGSFSGCAATTTGAAPLFVNITLNRANSNMNEMWGGPQSEVARYNDALINADKLRGTQNIYVSNGSGWPGEHDLPSDPRVDGNLLASARVMVEGGAIETATNTCTHDLEAKTRALDIPVTYNFRPQGTHQWGYWQDDLRDFWPIVTKGLGTNVPRPAEPHSQPATGNIFGSQQ